MCEEHYRNPAAVQAQLTFSEDAPGPTIDPIGLEPVDRIVVTTLIDNVFDSLVEDEGPAYRARMQRLTTVSAPQFEAAQTCPGLVAEHGFSALVTVWRGEKKHTLLFDTGASPDGVATNVERLGLDIGCVEVIVLSHGHFDHVGGLAGLSRLWGRVNLPLIVHPQVWAKRRLTVPTEPTWELPTLSRPALEAEGLMVVERRQPSLLLDGSMLITGEVERTTEYERGLPFHEAHTGSSWKPDPLILDDQALVVNLRNCGLVVLTGCGHAGIVNIARHALRLTGANRIYALIGGFHLGGREFEPIIEPTVAALVKMAPELVVGAHCTGWKAQYRLASALPDAFVLSTVGTSYSLSADLSGMVHKKMDAAAKTVAGSPRHDPESLKLPCAKIS